MDQNWLSRLGRQPGPSVAAPAEPLPAAVERASAGIAALFDRVAEDRSHAVLDVGAAIDSSLRVYSRFARWLRFADLLAAADSPEAWSAGLKALPQKADRPFDLVFAWDILDRLVPDERYRLVARLAELTAKDARLHLVVKAFGKPTTHPLRFSLLGTDRMRYEPTGPARPIGSPLLPAEVERVLAPFHVVRAFSSQVGLREYMAVRR